MISRRLPPRPRLRRRQCPRCPGVSAARFSAPSISRRRPRERRIHPAPCASCSRRQRTESAVPGKFPDPHLTDFGAPCITAGSASAAARPLPPRTTAPARTLPPLPLGPGGRDADHASMASRLSRQTMMEGIEKHGEQSCSAGNDAALGRIGVEFAKEAIASRLEWRKHQEALAPGASTFSSSAPGFQTLRHPSRRCAARSLKRVLGGHHDFLGETRPFFISSAKVGELLRAGALRREQAQSRQQNSQPLAPSEAHPCAHTHQG